MLRLIQVGLANINTTVGAFKANMEKIILEARAMSEAGCTVASFPESVIGGYPAEDVVFFDDFIKGQWVQLERFLQETAEMPTVFTLGIIVNHNNCIYNCQAVTYVGRLIGLVPKTHLPGYSVFYEGRTMTPWLPYRVEQYRTDFGNDGFAPIGDMIFRFAFGTLAVEVCEDIWSQDGPMRSRCFSGAELVINASASPYRHGVVDTRREMVIQRAADNQCALVYVNSFGGNDSLVFDGGGFINCCGRMLQETPRMIHNWYSQIIDLADVSNARKENTTWRYDLEMFRQQGKQVQEAKHRFSGPECNNDLPYPLPDFEENPSEILPFVPSGCLESAMKIGYDITPQGREFFGNIIDVLLTALSDYFEKNGCFDRYVLGLSGGKDSALCLMLCYLHAKRKFACLTGTALTEAIHDFIRTFSMPTSFNSDDSKELSRVLAEALGVSWKEVSIQEAFEHEVEQQSTMLGKGESLTRITRQNIQARIRGQRLWGISNSVKGLFVQTGNMTEKAVGYFTMGGDSEGCYCPIANVPKTLVTPLLNYLMEEFKDQPGIHEALEGVYVSIASAELEEDQQDEKELGPFEVLDLCLLLFIGKKKSPWETYHILCQIYRNQATLHTTFPYKYEPGDLKRWVLGFFNRFMNSIFKWVQTPMGAHIGTIDLDRERCLQFPVTMNREWLNLQQLEEDERGL